MTASTSLRPEASALLRYLRDHPGATAAQVATYAGVSTRSATGRLQTLYVRGLIGRARDAWSPYHWNYFPAEVKK